MSGEAGSTMLLDGENWDLCVDAAGNWALATAPYSAVQDVASAVRTFIGECYYATTVGVKYFQNELGHRPPLALVKADIVAAAMTVPGVKSATVFLSGIENGAVTGQIQITTVNGVKAVTNFVTAKVTANTLTSSDQLVSDGLEISR